MLNTVYAYLAEQAEAADAAALPVYRAAQVEEKQIQATTRRKALEDWISAPDERVQARDRALIKYITGT